MSYGFARFFHSKSLSKKGYSGYIDVPFEESEYAEPMVRLTVRHHIGVTKCVVLISINSIDMIFAMGFEYALGPSIHYFLTFIIS